MAKKSKKQQERSSQKRAQKRQTKAKKRVEVHRVAKAAAREEAQRAARARGADWADDPFSNEVLAAALFDWTHTETGYGGLAAVLQCARWEALATYEAWIEMGHPPAEGVVTRVSVEEASDEALEGLLSEAGIGADAEARVALCTGRLTAWELIEEVWRPLQEGPVDERLADALWLTLIEWWERTLPGTRCAEMVQFALEDVRLGVNEGELAEALELFAVVLDGLFGTIAASADPEGAPAALGLTTELEMTLDQLTGAVLEAESDVESVEDLLRVATELTRTWGAGSARTFGMLESRVVLLDALGRNEEADVALAEWIEDSPEDLRAIGYQLGRFGIWESQDPVLLGSTIARLGALAESAENEGARQVFAEWVDELQGLLVGLEEPAP